MPVSNPAIPIQEAWIAPTLQNGWFNLVSSTNPIGYWKDSFGVVHLRGYIRGGTAPPVTIFNLPSGYRPVNTEILCLWTYTGSASVLGYLSISSAGVVQIGQGSSWGCCVDGITFRAA